MLKSQKRGETPRRVRAARQNKVGTGPLSLVPPRPRASQHMSAPPVVMLKKPRVSKAKAAPKPRKVDRLSSVSLDALSGVRSLPTRWRCPN